MIGILGGTFDPVHVGHLRMALEALEKYHLEHIRIVPCRMPVDKKAPTISTQHRINMLKLALKPHRHQLILDECELKRETPSYMLETIKYFKKAMPRKKMGLIIGADRAHQFHRWHGYQEILSLVELIIMPRELAISSSDIRRKLLKNKNPAYLLPEAVLRYILKNKLYQK